MTKEHESDQPEFTFEEIFAQNKRRIHYHLHKLNIHDANGDFYQEGLVAMWNAYERYQPDKGPMATYFNYMIRNRLIDLLRKETRTDEHMRNFVQAEKHKVDNGNTRKSRDTRYALPNEVGLQIDDSYLWKQVKDHLTENQWKWVYYRIVCDMPLKEIAILENTTLEAVKSWGKQARKKLQDPAFQERIL